MPAARPRPLRLIPQIHRATHGLGLRITAATDLAQAEAHILQHLAVEGDSTVGELHRAFAHRRSTLTSVLDRLEGRELIARTASRADRRTFLVSLTSTGKTAAARVHAALQGIEKNAVDEVGDRDLKGFAAVLEALEATLRRPGRTRRG